MHSILRIRRKIFTIKEIGYDFNFAGYDTLGVPCLDAVNYIEFGLAGDGQLIENQGTSTGSRKVQAYNGRAAIRVDKRKGESVVSVRCDIPEVKTVFVRL